jgi:hypothetical protein
MFPECFIFCYLTLDFLYLLQAMKRETSGDFLNALRAIIKCTHYPAKYFAKVRFGW